MDPNVIECDMAERDPGVCVCKGGPTLGILKDIQRAYEQRMELIDKVGGSNKLKMQVDVLRSWVSDLVGQNTLLARAVEELETETSARLQHERRRHAEVESDLRAEKGALRRRVARADADVRGLVEVLRRLREFDYCTLEGIHFFEVTESDIFGSVEWRQKKLDQGDRHKTRNTSGDVIQLKLLNETLQKENSAKDREIQKLNKDIHHYEQTIMNLRSEMSLTKYHTPDVSKKDAEVMAGMCCTGHGECGDWEPVKDFSAILREETVKYQERIQNMEDNLKCSSNSVRELRKANVSLAEEAHALRRACAALDAQARAAAMRAHFKDDIIREMRRQLKQAKTKLKEVSDLSSFKSYKQPTSDDHDYDRSPSASYDSVTIACVRTQPRRTRPAAPPQAARAPAAGTPRDGSGDDSLCLPSS